MASDANRNQLLVAVLGLVGVVVTTVSSNWDKLFPPAGVHPASDLYPPRHPNSASHPTASLHPLAPRDPLALRHPHLTRRPPSPRSRTPARAPPTPTHPDAAYDDHADYVAAPWRARGAENRRGRGDACGAP